MRQRSLEPAVFRILLWLLGLLAVGLAVYLGIVERPRPVYQHVVDRSLLYVHIASAGMAIVLGPALFLRRSRHVVLVSLHRWFGRWYASSAIVASISAVVVARLYAPGGWVSQLGIAMAAGVWAIATLAAWWHIRRRHVAEHQQWMIRSYALALGFLTHRFWITGVTALMAATAGDTRYGAPIGDWLFWLCNLLIAEAIIGFTRRQRRQALSPSFRHPLSPQPDFD